MSKVLVAYFSVGGKTAGVAKELAAAESADLFEIRPVTPYTPEDLNFKNEQSRSTLEMKDPDCRPPLAEAADASAYDVIFVGFPIWWGREPSIVDTFLESAGLQGKKVIPFCTSGISDAATATERIRSIVGGDAVEEGKRFGDASEEEVKTWTELLDL